MNVSWTIKKAEHQRTDAFELWCWRRLLRVPWTARRSIQSILKEISPEYSLEGLMLELKLQYFGHLMRRTDSLEKTLMLGKIKGRRRGQQRMKWLDGIANSMDRIWWRTGKPGVLQSIGLQRVGHDWTTELTDWSNLTCMQRLRCRNSRGVVLYAFQTCPPAEPCPCPVGLMPAQINPSAPSEHILSLSQNSGSHAWVLFAGTYIQALGSPGVQPVNYIYTLAGASLGLWDIQWQGPYTSVHENLTLNNTWTTLENWPYRCFWTDHSSKLQISIFPLPGGQFLWDFSLASAGVNSQPHVALAKPWENHHGKRVKAKYSNTA